MTTLPQTATLRLPGTPAVTQIAAPMAPPMGYLPTTASQGPQMTGADVWRVFRVNLWLIILLSLLFGAAGFYLNDYWLLKYYPKYTATASLLINADTGDSDPLHPYVRGLDIQGLIVEQQTEITQLRQPYLWSEVLQNDQSPIHQTAWIHQFSDTSEEKKDLADNLTAVAALNNKLITVSMTGTNPRDCEKILKSIVDQRIKDQEDLNTRTEERRSQDLQTMHDQDSLRYNEVTNSMNDEESELNISPSSGSGRLNTLYTEVQELNGRKIDDDLKLADAQARLSDLTTAINSRQDPPEIMDKVNNYPDYLRYSQALSSIDAELTEMLKTYPEKNQQVQDLEDQRAMYQSKATEAQASALAQYEAGAREQLNREVEGDTLAAKLISAQLQAVDNDIADLSHKLTDYNTHKEEQTLYKNRLTAEEDEMKNVQDRIGQKDMNTISWNALPEAADIPTWPNRKVTIGVAAVVGAMLGLMIAFLRELMDTSVRTPRDISRVGSMTLLGMVQHEADDPQSQGARLPLVIFEAPQSMMAEQLRQVRTRLQHGASLDTTRSILITSPGPDDGKSTIACNLASGLALNGRRILLVDANFRRPSLHRTFNLGNDHGFSDVLNSLDLFETAVQETTVPNLYVLPTGPKPTNATELLESQLLIDFIERALEEFDHVIFDSGPLLFVSETVALAPRVDGVVTVVRARSNSRGVLQRMRDALRQIKAEHLGVVLNAVRSRGGGYYRSNIRTYYDYQNDRAA